MRVRLPPPAHLLRKFLGEREHPAGSVLVFARFDADPEGGPIKPYNTDWRRAWKASKLPQIPHDFRRTAVRNLERAGVARSAATAMVGHKTEAIYRRYAIVEEAMLREAAQKLTAFQARQMKANSAGVNPASHAPAPSAPEQPAKQNAQTRAHRLVR